MKKVYIVDDNREDLDRFKMYVDKYAQEAEIDIEVTEFMNGAYFLDKYDGNCDVVFIDIQMPYINGLAATKRLRLVDPIVPVIFVTNLAQYAVDGYEVSALDFIVKPVTYTGFKQKLEKALKRSEALAGKFVFIDEGQGAKKVRIADIIYIEKEHNNAAYHTIDGILRRRETLGVIENEINDASFGRCNSGCLVNYRYIKSYTGSTVNVGQAELAISRGKRKSFLDGLVQFYGGGGGYK